jgi:hypothetical protein
MDDEFVMWAARDKRTGYFESVWPDERSTRSERGSDERFDIVQVCVRVDPAGDYFGWVATDAMRPNMIHWHPTGYRMQFPYGPTAYERDGLGKTTKLTVVQLDAA